jgi:hypothetical protein
VPVCCSCSAVRFNRRRKRRSKPRRRSRRKRRPKAEAPAKAAREREAYEAAIRANVESLAKAANAQDAKAVAATFTATGEFVDGDGNVFHVHGRAAIEAEFKALFKANPMGHLEITAAELRPQPRGRGRDAARAAPAA